MAKEVESQFTSAQLEDYGNVILNGYLSVVPNTINKKAWQYKETTSAPVNLPSLTEVRPALKGWTTNYMRYYTELPPNAYSVNPGDPTMFEYVVHSFTPQTGPISTLSWVSPGTGYTPGTYYGVPLTGGSGFGATANIVVEASPDPLVIGFVKSATLVNPGTGYLQYDSLTAVLPGGTGFRVLVNAINPIPGTGNAPRWSQPPRRLISNEILPSTPPDHNLKANPYSAVLYPSTM
jgi:hypothetical protein